MTNAALLGVATRRSSCPSLGASSARAARRRRDGATATSWTCERASRSRSRQSTAARTSASCSRALLADQTRIAGSTSPDLHHPERWSLTIGAAPALRQRRRRASSPRSRGGAGRCSSHVRTSGSRAGSRRATSRSGAVPRAARRTISFVVGDVRLRLAREGSARRAARRPSRGSPARRSRAAERPATRGAREPRPYTGGDADVTARRRAAAPPRVDEGAGAERRRPLLRRPQAAPRREPRHGVRGGALPQHRRVLGTRHRDVPDPRRHVHARVPVLLRQLRQARGAARPARAAPPRPGRRDDGARARRRHVRRPRRPARPRRRRTSRRRSARSRRKLPDVARSRC